MHAGFNARTTPWEIDESNYSTLGSLKERARFLVGYAVLAPSGHNTQPWKFGPVDDGVLVYADYSRRLPVANPDDRELLMSVAAAIMNFQVAAAHFGLACEVRHVPEPDNFELLAYVRIGEGEVDRDLAGLFDGIMKRRTNRSAYESKSLAPADADALAGLTSLGAASGAIIVDEDAIEKLAQVVAEGDLRRMADKAFTRELSEWIRPNGTTASDGMLAASLGIPPVVSPVAPWLVRTFNTSKSQAKKEAEAVRRSAAILLLHAGDDKKSVLEAGQLLERMLLKCALLGIQYSFFNLPVELDDLRARIKSLAGVSDEPQLLLRLGYAKPSETATPRRPLSEVLLES